MTEGMLKLKHDAGGYRHYIETAQGEHVDLHCGCRLAVQLAKMNDNRCSYLDEVSYAPAGWLQGRYEGSLWGPEARAYLYFTLLPGLEVSCPLPEGVKVKTYF
ncbi:hypothetical protein SDD30_01560 [Moorella naiadis]|uniref:hypothetical protein n=1 Tax=Moorella naiadis (nom. illeg.) TaxID=3093670 RepID=UPI003D9CB494